MSASDEIKAILTGRTCWITYQALRTEVSATDGIPLPERVRIYQIPPRAGVDPLEEAKKAMDFAGDASTCLLIPGRAFDASGTRHGQGGGWYDRFLASVPREWLRIGFCYDDQLSPTPLTRASWDQTMDYVVTVGRTDSSLTVYSSEGTHD